MRTFRREGRLSEDEAREDVERLDRAAAEVGLPNIEDLHHTEDVQALERLLVEAGLYETPTVSDEIVFGAGRLAELKRIAVEKSPREVHYEEQVIAAVRNAFSDRFDLDVPTFPTERILLIPDHAMGKLSAGPLGARTPQEHARVGGTYDPLHEIILIRYRAQDALAARIHVAGHEVVHWALHQQADYSTPTLDAFRRLMHEGITEQVTLETTPPILAEPDLIDGARTWLSSSGWTTRDIAGEVPTLARFAMPGSVEPNARYNITAYAYPFERFLLEDIAVAFHRRGLVVDDPLRVFVRALTNTDIGTLKRLLRETYGATAVKLLLSPGPRSILEVSSELHGFLKEKDS